MKKVFLVLKEDIVGYPPVLSIMQALLDLNVQVDVVGSYSDQEQRMRYEKKGVKFSDLKPYNGFTSLPGKLSQMISYQRYVKKYLSENCKKDDFVWIMLAENVFLFSDIISKYKTILHFFEYVDPKINWKYKILNPFFDMGQACRDAYRIVCCEYNRAHITKGIFGLNELPHILPNKYFAEDSELSNPPEEIQNVVREIKEKTNGKNIILYQGIFLDKERRLEEFIQAVNSLGDNYVLIAMGRGSQMYDDLKKKYSSDKIIFIDFIKPPYHLLITRLAKIGILSYFPRPKSMGAVINPLYCAPNKIFEYSRYSIPMLSNDVPALMSAFKEYNCGEVVTYPMTPDKISEKIEYILNNYNEYSVGAKAYYDSVDIIKIVNDIIA